MSRRRFLTGATTLTAGVAAAAACGGGTAPHESGGAATSGAVDRGSTLRSALFFDPDNLDPSEGGFGFPIFQRTYSYLHHIHGETLEYIPDLATEFEQVDELTYIFNLRSGVRFQDLSPVNGRELVAEDIVYSLNRLRIALNSIDPSYMNRIVDAVDSPDERTVRVVNRRPYASTMQVLGGFWYAIVPREAVEQVKRLNERAIGSGPFILESYEQERGGVLRRNPTYYGAPAPALGGMEIGVITDTTNLLTQFRTKNLDVNTAPLDFPRFEALKNDLDGVMSSKTPGILDPWIGLHMGKPPFNDIRVRQAFDLAIDREAMISQIAFGDAKLNGPIPWGNQLWALPQEELQQTYRTDLNEARRLLDEAGVGEIKLRHVVTPALPLGIEIGQFIKERLKPLGIEIVLDVQEQNAFIEDVFLKQHFDTCSFAWFPVLDPAVSLRFVDQNDIFARVFSFVSADVTRLYEKMQATFDLEERKAVMNDLQRAILDLHGPVLHLFDMYQYNLWWPWVHEWRPENIELNGYNNDIFMTERI